jgi:hypothetical protein
MYNPFLVEIHEKLLDIYKKLKKNDLLNDEKWNLNKLTPSL